MTAAVFHQDPRVVLGFLRFSRIVAVLMCAIALIVLAGWWWDLPRLTRITPGQPPMRIAVAIALALSGMALLFHHTSYTWRYRIGLVLSLIVLVIGAVTLVEHLSWVELRFGHLLDLLPRHVANPSDSHLAEAAALALLLLGALGLLVSARCWPLLRDVAAIALLAIAMTGLASQGGAMAGTENPVFDQMPIHASLMLLLAALGWLSAEPTTGLTRVTTAATFGGAFSRRVLLPALLLPIVFTYVFRLLQSWFNLQETLAFALMAVFTGGAVAVLIWWVAVLLDKLERQRRVAERLRSDADTDTLTGLANRRAFDNALARLVLGERERDVVFSLLMLDLDRFKRYNDAFGHLAGDEILRLVGGLLGSVLRPTDMAARYGGEEFAVLLQDTDLTQASEIATRILEAFRRFPWPQRAVTISIGVAQADRQEDARDLIRRADEALYAAKNAGRDRAVVASAKILPLAEPTGG